VPVQGFIRLPDGLPGVKGIMGVKPSGHEPFRKETAVIANPHARNDSGDGGQFTSSQYLEPGYENRQDSNYKIDKMLKELQEYNPQELMKNCQALGEIPVNVAPVPPPHPPEMDAAWFAWAKVNLDGPRKQTGLWAQGISKGVDSAYKERLARERELFNK
jgi:hypothetical protein